MLHAAQHWGPPTPHSFPEEHIFGGPLTAFVPQKPPLVLSAISQDGRETPHVLRREARAADDDIATRHCWHRGGQAMTQARAMLAQVVPAPPKPGGTHRPLPQTPPEHAPTSRPRGWLQAERRPVPSPGCSGGDVGRREPRRVLGAAAVENSLAAPLEVPTTPAAPLLGVIACPRRDVGAGVHGGGEWTQPQRPPAKHKDDGQSRPRRGSQSGRKTQHWACSDADAPEVTAAGGQAHSQRPRVLQPRPQTAGNRWIHRDSTLAGSGQGQEP